MKGYHETAKATLAVVQAWSVKHHDCPPLFAFPPPEIALAASLADIGDRLARNESAPS